MAAPLPRLLLTLREGRATFRIVEVAYENTDGVPTTGAVVERTYDNDQDALGVQRWTPVTAERSGMSDYIAFTKVLLAHVLAERD
jgi:hypothetical protein